MSLREAKSELEGRLADLYVKHPELVGYRLDCCMSPWCNNNNTNLTVEQICALEEILELKYMLGR